VADLGGDDAKVLAAAVKDSAVAAGEGEKVCRAAVAIARLLANPVLAAALDVILVLYLQLWLMDNAAIAAYAAQNVQFDLRDPPPEYWYQRTDTQGEHRFFSEGNYLINRIPATEGKHKDKDAYFNAEIYNSTQTSLPPKNVIANLWPVDSPSDRKHFLYDLFLDVPYVPANGLAFEARIKVENLKGGSRGWGFWNTDVFPLSMQVAWFIQLDGEPNSGVKPSLPNGFYAVTQNGLSYLPYRLKQPLDEDWHDYRIEIGPQSVEYFVDGTSVWRVDQNGSIPTAPMSFHNWVDNAVFGFQGGELTHILQKTKLPRGNIMQHLRIASIPSLAAKSGA